MTAKILCASVAVVLFVPACRLFMPDKYEALDRCATVLPVLREYPTRPYSIVGGKTVKIHEEQALRYETCEAGADAVVISPEDARQKGRSGKPVLVGVFIRYTDAEQPAQ